MTVVAWDGITLAADSRIVCETTGDYRANKVERIESALYGWAGGHAEAAQLLAWVRGGQDVESFPIEAAQAEVGAPVLMRVSADGVFFLERYPVWFEAIEKQFAIGTGSHYARSAMAFGLTAEQAVAFAIERDSNCGGPVVTLRLP